MKTVKTAKGTELQVMSLKGKDYMQVQQRLLWFVEENPRYDITTEFIKLNDEEAVAKCTISILEDTPAGVRVVRKVVDYKTENGKSFPDFVEKAATGACGRCLSLLGYGTQFAADLDEGDRIVDSPVTVVAKTTAALKPAAKKEATTTVTSETSTDDTVSAATAPSTEVAATTPAAIPAKPANRFARKSTGGEFKL